ncbi:MAG: DUF4982 domain-containing protein [Bacteroidetes bacterium]|nr:DUF4982 domain-containing protein [Bacteroidota bacterium]
MRCFFIVFLVMNVLGGWAQQSVRLTDHWEFLRSDLGSVWEAVRPVTKGDPGSVPAWQPVRLPHCVNARDGVDPDVNYYQGPAWYRTRLVVRNPFAGGRTLLHFEGAGQETDVYVYTTKVGSHVGGYDEWTVDLTDAVKAYGKDTVPISIRCDNSRNVERIPSALSDFTIYGGLYRYVDLEYVPAVSIASVFADVTREGRVAVHTKLYGGKATGMSVKLTDPEGKVVYSAKDTTAFMVKNPRLWSTERPVLYKLEVAIEGGASKSVEVGFRDFQFVDHGPFLLNGQRLLIRGTHRHEDHAGVGAAMTEEMMRSEMIMMKEMGVNYIRLAHYQQSSIILHLCDSLGILVWEEIPWCRGGLGGSVYQEQARRMLTNMIGQHYNHPSVIIWGLGNENDWPGDFPEYDKKAIHAFMSGLNDLAHRLDPSRKTAIRRCDFCSDIPDVYSPSIWAGWYRGIYTEYKSSSEEEFRKVPHFLHMEWGGDSHAGRHSENPDKALIGVVGGQGTDERSGDASLYGGAARVSKDGDWSESYICNLFDWHLKEQETMPWLTGAAQWVFKDFATPLRPDNPVPFVNQKGVVERDGKKKESYYVFQSYWATKLMAHIYGHSWPVRWGAEGEQKMVKVYSNAEAVELFLNGKGAGVRKRNSSDFPAAGLRWNLVLRPGENVVRVVARRGKEVVEDSIRFVYQTQTWGKPARVVLERLDSVTVRARLLDEKGVLCLNAANWIRWGLAGDGRLIDDLGTSTGSRYVQAFNGMGEIRVVKGGRSVVSVSVEGLKTEFLTLE